MYFQVIIVILVMSKKFDLGVFESGPTKTKFYLGEGEKKKMGTWLNKFKFENK